MDIFSRLGSVVNLAVGKFKIGKAEWGVMTYSNRRRWVFPLVPNARPFARLGEYPRGRSTRPMEALMVREDREYECDVCK